MTGFVLVALGAAVGAPVRYLVDRMIQARHDSVMPWGTLAVNVAGSLVLGVLVGAARHLDVPEEAVLVAGPGLCGTVTTYSTFSFETLRLVEDGAVLYAVVNVVSSLTAGLAAVALGYVIGVAL